MREMAEKLGGEGQMPFINGYDPNSTPFRNPGRHFDSESVDSADLVKSCASLDQEQLGGDGIFRPGFPSVKDARVSNGAPPRGSESSFSNENGMHSGNQVEAEWIEQYESGVYITLVVFKDGTRDLKRVRFSRRRFEQQQAEVWWKENQEKVYEKYNVWWPDEPSLVPPSR